MAKRHEREHLLRRRELIEPRALIFQHILDQNRRDTIVSLHFRVSTRVPSINMSTKLIQQDDERRRRRRRAQPTRVRARHPLSIHLLSLHRALHATQRFSKRRPYLFVRDRHRIARREPLAFIRIVERLRAVRKPILAHRARRLSRERLRLARDRVTSLERRLASLASLERRRARCRHRGASPRAGGGSRCDETRRRVNRQRRAPRERERERGGERGRRHR